MYFDSLVPFRISKFGFRIYKCMVFFGDHLNLSLSEGIAKELSASVNYPDIKVFPDGERRIRLLQEVVDENVIFVKTASATNSWDSLILETAFLIDAIKRSGASQITGIIPYFPYSRADHVFRTGEAVPLEVVINMFESAGLTKVVFVDPHTIKMPEMFKIDVVNLSALPLFADKIKEIGFDKKNSVIVSPDMGGLRRLEQLSHLLHGLPIASVEKDRDYDNGSISASAVHGEIKETCFVIDDIISSGRTIVQAVEQIAERGGKHIYIFATHPVFSEDAVKLLKNSNVEKIYVTDAIPVPKEQNFEKLEVLSLDSLVANYLRG